MALGNTGTGESAVLEIEVDTRAFEAGMNDVQKKADQGANKINKSYEFMGNGIKKTFAANTEVAKKSFADQVQAARQSWAQIAGTIAAGSLLVRKYFALMESGAGEGGKAVKKLEESFTKLGAAAGEQQARVWQPLFEAITSVNEAASASPSIISGVTAAVLSSASAILGMANAAGVLKDQLARLASGGSTEAEIRAGAEAATQGNAAAGLRDLANGTSVGRALSSIGSSIARAGTATVGGVTNAARMAAIRRERNDMSAAAAAAQAGGSQRGTGGAGGGGGGGGESEEARQLAMLAQFYEQLAAAELHEAQVRKDANAAHVAAVEAFAAERESVLDENTRRARAESIEHNARLETQAETRADKDRFYAEQAIQLEGERQTALMATADAIETVNAVLMKGGPAAQALARVLMAVQGVIYAQKAAGEVGEAIAAAARYDTWGAVGHAAAAVQFGVAAGMKLGAAVGGGGGAPRASGGGGAPQGMASPRGGGGADGGGPLNVTIVLNAAGEVVDDSTLRRLGRAISEIERRGHWQPRGY